MSVETGMFSTFEMAPLEVTLILQRRPHVAGLILRPEILTVASYKRALIPSRILLCHRVLLFCQHSECAMARP